MPTNQPFFHPWMANSGSSIKEEMLAETGAATIEELFSQIPESHRRRRPLDLPPSLRSESELRRHLVTTLDRNRNAEQYLSFLGAGCWQHHVPAVVDEIVGRTEFLTPVWGSPQSDHGRNQAWFEFNSQLGELLHADVVQLPVYSWGCAIGHAVRMAARMTGRREVLLPYHIDPERLSVVQSYCEPPDMPDHVRIVQVAADGATGGLDLADLRARISGDTAAVYFEQPGYLGAIDPAAGEIAAIARSHGAETIVGVDPISLGILKAPGDYGADIMVGPTQPLGVHMNCGGGVGGFMASRDEERYVREFNGFLVSIAPTRKPGEFGFGLASAHQTSYGMREDGKDWTGNSVYLWAIANAVYMSLLGPDGFREVGELIVSRANYAARRLGQIDNVRIGSAGSVFKEFIVDFNATGRTVEQVNRKLRKRHRIFGGKDISAEFPEMGQSALYCVTEIHALEDIDRLAHALEEVLS